MTPAELVTVKCHCCDTVFQFPKEILAKMTLPATFCRRCFNRHDDLMLRKWFVMDMLYRQVQTHSAALRQLGIQLPAM
jgi:hypothetical protein